MSLRRSWYSAVVKIARITPFLVAAQPSSDGWSQGHIALLVKLETQDGLVGWGEAFALPHRQRSIREILIALGEALMQMTHASPRAFLQHVAEPMTSKHPSLDYAAAVSALEIALWDLAGKAAGLPVHALLGGAILERVPVYANAWDNPVRTPDEIAERCAMMHAQGYRAVKIYPLRQADLQASETLVRLAREAVGPDTDLMLDFAIEPDPRRALHAARLFELYTPYWIEEPISGDDLEALAEFRRATDIRITTGERQAGLAHFRNVLDKRAADVLNPDIAGAGGMLRMLEIGAMAEARSVTISPHSWNSTTVAFAAMLQVCAVLRNAGHAELHYDYLDLGATYSRGDFTIENGYASVPQTPGLGIEIDEPALQSLCLTT